MSEEGASADKSEEPTARRLEDALKKGQTPASREPAIFASILVFLFWTLFGAADAVRGAGEALRGVWFVAGTLEPARGDVAVLSRALLGELALFFAPLLAALVIAGLVAGLVQAEPRFVGERIRPQLSRISLVKGWSRVFGKRGLFEFGKALVKIGTAGIVAGIVLREAVPLLADFMRRAPSAFLSVTVDLVLQLLAAICVTTLLVAAADIAWSRHTWRQGLRMSRKDVADENKQSEGDPILKARRLSLMRDRSRRRMLDAVPQATVVIANPVHVAVALRYRHEEDPAPVVVAKGGDHLCLKIRALAQASGVPVLERVELARALYKVAEVDRPIPEAFYGAIAEIINFVMSPARQRHGASVGARPSVMRS